MKTNKQGRIVPPSI